MAANALVSSISSHPTGQREREAVPVSSGSVLPSDSETREGGLVPGPSHSLLHPYLGDSETLSASKYALPWPTLVGNPICRRCSFRQRSLDRLC